MNTNTIEPEHHGQRAPTGLVEAMHRIEGAAELDTYAAYLERVAGAVAPPGPASDILRGTWLGHALHPLLTDIPLGSWLSASLLDMLGGKQSRKAAQRLVGIGILTAAPTAASGLADWLHADKPARRVGVVHAVTNSTALLLYIRSYGARRRGHHFLGVAFAVAGGVAAIAGGYLGGHLSLARKVGYRDPSFESPSETTAGREGEIVEPPHSTVDDWIGQQAARDEEVVDELLDETGGDVQEAERRFPERSHEDRPDQLPTEERRT